MKTVRAVAMIIMGLTTAGCASMDVASRNAPYEAPNSAIIAPAMKVESYQVRVPRELKVSEANLYYPPGDIVWRGEPLGDRHVQVQKIFEGAMANAIPSTETGVPVLVDVEVTRFHALTEKARYTTGGVHSISFKINFLNPETLQPVTEGRVVKADLKAFGGARAIAAERNGVTQKKRISAHLTNVLRTQMGGETQEQVIATKPIRVVPETPVVTRNLTPLESGDRTNGLF